MGRTGSSKAGFRGLGPEAPSPQTWEGPTRASGVLGRICGWQSLGPWGCRSDNIPSLCQLWGPASCNICLTISPETALFRTKMKNMTLGLVVFSLLSKFLCALGRGVGSLAPPPQGRTEAGVGSPRFCSPSVPVGAWEQVLSLPRCSKGANFRLRGEEVRRIFG